VSVHDKFMLRDSRRSRLIEVKPRESVLIVIVAADALVSENSIMRSHETIVGAMAGATARRRYRIAASRTESRAVSQLRFECANLSPAMAAAVVGRLPSPFPLELGEYLISSKRRIVRPFGLQVAALYAASIRRQSGPKGIYGKDMFGVISARYRDKFSCRLPVCRDC